MNRTISVFGAILAFLLPLWCVAQIASDPIAVPIAFQGTFEPMTPGSGDLAVEVQAGFPWVTSGTVNHVPVTELAHIYVRPGQSYPVELTTSGLKTVHVKITAPAGYKVFVDEVEHDMYSWYDGGSQLAPRRVFNLRLEFPGGQSVGEAASLRPGRVRWSVGLGKLKNGEPAGSLHISEPEMSSLVYQPEGLFFDRDSGGTNNGRYVSAGEVIVVKEYGAVRQVYASAVLADIVRRDSAGYWIRLYSRSQVSDPNGAGTFAVSGVPLYEFLIENPTPSTLDKLRITRTTNQNGQLVMWTEMSKSTPSAGKTVWLVQDWVEKTAGVTTVDSPIRHRWSIEDDGRIELQEVLDRSGNVASKTMRYYQDYWFGVEGARELWREIEGYESDSAIEKEYTYGQEFGRGSWHKITRVKCSDGSWVAYSYYDEFERMGRLRETRRQFKNSPVADPGSYTNDGESTTISYEYTDQFGGQKLPTRIETRIDGKVVALSEISYSQETITDSSRTYSGANATMPIVVATRNDYSAAGQCITTVTRTYREDADRQYRFFPGLIRSIERPDRTMTLKLYSPATFTSGTLTYDSNGSCTAAITVEGTNDTTVGSSPAGSYAGLQSIPTNFRVVSGKSIETISVLDALGQSVLARTSAYVGTWQKLSEDETLHLECFGPATVTHRTPTGSWVQTSNTWEKGRLTATVEGTGIRESFTYDSVGRVETVTRDGAVSGTTSIAAQVTSTTYDAMRRPLTRTKTGSGESLVESWTYDLVGRSLTESIPGQTGPSVISYSYNVAARTKTATFPVGSSTETLYADGRLASVSGTAVVGEFRDYIVESDGRRRTVLRLGGINDVRRREVVTDWLGRSVEQRRPGINGNADIVETMGYDPVRGNLVVSGASGGFADIRYEYNSLGEMIRYGMDVNGGGLANVSTDRIGERDTTIEAYDGAYWRTSRAWKFYVNNVDSKKLVSIRRERLTGLTSSLRAEVRSSDAEGNETRSVVTTDSASKTVTTSLTVPGQANVATETALNGVQISSVGLDGLAHRWEYDALGRVSKEIDPRKGVAASGTISYYPNTVLPYQRRDSRNVVVETFSYDGMGRVAVHGNAIGNVVRMAYNSRGQVEYVWGAGTYPVSYVYNGYGERTRQRTYQDTSIDWNSVVWPSTASVTSETEWQYDAASGALLKEYDTSRRSVEYSYNARGELYQRFWARSIGANRVTTTYGYVPTTGELSSVNYSDGTPALQYAYTRAGQLDWVTDVTGTRDFSYDPSSPWRLVAEGMSGFYGDRLLSRTYESQTSTNLGSGGYTGHVLGGVLGRSSGFQLGTTGALNADMEFRVAFNNGDRVAGYVAKRNSGSVTRQFVLGYLTNSSLLRSVSVVNNGFYVERGFEPNRDLMTSLEARWSGSAVTRFDYTYDDLGRRQNVVKSGAAFSDYGDSTHEIYGYNARNELTSAFAYMGANPTSTGNPLSARLNQFDFDAAGNRKWSDSSGVTNLRDDYSPNNLDQYSTRENNTLSVAGTADAGAKVVVAADQVTLAGRAGRYWGNNVALSNLTRPAANPISIYSAKVGGAAGGTDAIRKDVRTGFIAAANQTFTYDEDGNLKSDGVWDYQWDAENRLTQMTTTEVAAVGGYPRRRVEFRYDFLDRRVQKLVYNDATNVLLSGTRFLYEGSKLIAEFRTETGSLSLRRSYVWGASTIGGSDGVGELMQIADHDSGRTYFPTYDGSGNVATLIDADSGTTEAVYEYSPFGVLLRCEGSYARENPFRYSTRYYDSETELSVYLKRYYSATCGRWISRDPIGESGGSNPYRFCSNDPINRWDIRGEGDEDSKDDTVKLPPWYVNSTRWQDLTTNAYSGGWNIDGYVTSEGWDIRPGETAASFTVYGPMLRPGERFKNKNGTGPVYVVVSDGGADRSGNQIWNVLPESEFKRAQAAEHKAFGEKVIKEQVAQEMASLGKTAANSIAVNIPSSGKSNGLTFREGVSAFFSGFGEGAYDVAMAFRALPEGIGGLAGAASVDFVGTVSQVHDTITTNLANGYILASETTFADVQRDFFEVGNLYINDHDFRQDVTKSLAGTATGIAIGGVPGAFRRGNVPATATPPASTAPAQRMRARLALPAPKIIRHHIFNKFRGNSPASQVYREFFKKHRIEVDKYTVEMSETMHQRFIHAGGNNWTTRWKQWIDANPNASTKEVYQFAGQLMDEYGISNLPIIPYR